MCCLVLDKVEFFRHQRLNP